MAERKVSEMPQANAVNDSDLLMIVQGMINKKVTKQVLMEDVNSEISNLSDNTYTKTQTDTLLNNKVDKVTGKGLSTNDFTNEYKQQITTNQTAITNIKDGTTIDSFGDVETALNGKEDKSNKVTELTDQSTDVEYPSAKCVYDELEAKQNEIDSLQQDVEDLRNASLKVNGEGTDITLQNTASARLLDVELEGKTSQETLTGRNLFDKNITPYNNSGGNITILNTGVRLISTRSSSNTYGFQLYKILDLSNYIGSTIRIKMDFTASNNIIKPTFKIGFCDENGQNRVAMASTDISGTVISFNVSSISEDNKYLAVWLYITEQTALAEGDYVDYTDIILTIDNADMTYEPYCGRNPSTKSTDINVLLKM